MNNLYRASLLIATGFLTVACSSAASDWNAATAVNTMTAYQAFLQKHAGDPHADEARVRIGQLQEDEAWTAAQSGNSEKSYGDYVQQRPDGAHVGQAREQLTALQRAAAWKLAQNDGSAEALRTFLDKYPQGTEADQARQKLAALVGYRVQLEATRSKTAAERKLAFAQRHFGKELHQVEIASPNPPDSTYRVLSGSMSQSEASSACQVLKRAHEACEVVGAG